MAAGEPGILVDDAAQRAAELAVGALPQGPEGACRRDDRIAENAELGADLGQLVGHAGAAGNAVDQPLGAFEDGLQDARRPRRLPQDVHVDAAVAARNLVSQARLGDAAVDGVGDQLLVAIASGTATINLRNDLALVVERIGVDAGEGPDTAGGGKGAGAAPVGNRDALAAFDDRQHLAARDWKSVQQCLNSPPFPSSVTMRRTAAAPSGMVQLSP